MSVQGTENMRPQLKGVLFMVWTHQLLGTRTVGRMKFEQQQQLPIRGSSSDPGECQPGNPSDGCFQEPGTPYIRQTLPSVQASMSPERTVLGTSSGALLLTRLTYFRRSCYWKRYDVQEVPFKDFYFGGGRRGRANPLTLLFLHNKSKHYYLWDERPGHQTAGCGAKGYRVMQEASSGFSYLKTRAQKQILHLKACKGTS